MKFDIQNVTDPGMMGTERLVLKATVDADIGRFAIFRGRNADEKKVLSGPNAADWFPDKEIKAGDLVVLYSKSGASSEKSIGPGQKSHFFYWNSQSALWVKGFTPVCLEISTWNTGQRFE